MKCPVCDLPGLVGCPCPACGFVSDRDLRKQIRGRHAVMAAARLSPRPQLPMTRTPDEEARALHADGYRQISNRFGIVARCTLTDDELRDFFCREWRQTPDSIAQMEVRLLREQWRRVYAREEDRVEGLDRKTMRALRDMGD